MFDKVLVIAPHADDGELGCGGTIARLIEEGKEVTYLSFTFPPIDGATGVASKDAEQELRQALKCLGCDRLFFETYNIKYFNSMRQHILEYLLTFDKTHGKFDVIFVPCSGDIHQDHQVIHNEAIRTFKKKIILGYYMPWNVKKFPCDLFVRLKKHHVEKKIQALQCYGSQSFRPFFERCDELVWGLASVRGLQCDEQYAEAFEVIRSII